jgi:cytochrome c oxidase assembly protein subunit 15
MVASLIVLMILVGGYVRLSRAGLSIVEWDVFTGILPPIGEDAWNETFDLYKQTPEYIKVNAGMSLSEYQRIFYIEWGHRLIARFVGLLVVVPLIWFMWKGLLGFRESLRYWGIAALFAFQGFLGWLMVSSGLVDRPAVSQYRLTIHLLAALLLLGIVLWMALDRMGLGSGGEVTRGRAPSWILLGAVVLQIAYGGLVAGLKAGYISDTWPLMFGQLIPDDVWTNLVNMVGSHWFHRWFAFAVAGIAFWAFLAIRRDRPNDAFLRLATGWLLAVVGAQIALGVSVVLFGVPKWIALAHQGMGVALFCVSLVIAHRVTSGVATPVPDRTPQRV